MFLKRGLGGTKGLPAFPFITTHHHKGLQYVLFKVKKSALHIMFQAGIFYLCANSVNIAFVQFGAIWYLCVTVVTLQLRLHFPSLP